MIEALKTLWNSVETTIDAEDGAFSALSNSVRNTGEVKSKKNTLTKKKNV